MRRKDFLKRGLGVLGAVAITPLVGACGSDDAVVPSDADSGVLGEAADDCVLTPSETEGPFPTKSPSSLQRVDIRGDRAGIEMTINITIQNKNDSCAPLEGAMVDIWHCDADGSYSEYGGTGMQAVNYTSEHFLRGRQVTDADGLASFVSIFPGWYSSRAPHIHVHVYDSAGNSLLITQMAFPEDICDTVYTTATTIYQKGPQDTSNELDNVFSDGVDEELAVLSGNVDDGFELTHTIVVSA